MRQVSRFFFILFLAFCSPLILAGQSTKPASPTGILNLVSPAESEGRLIWPTHASSEEIFGLSILPEPLVPVGKVPSFEDNQALLDALKRYDQRKTVEDVSALTAYLERYPNSPWRVALLANLGIHYYRAGYFSEALNAWEAAWKEGRDEKSPAGKALVDRAVGELARMQRPHRPYRAPESLV
jgi:hypothetical protein